jgi:photosystem II stability/assembly factor-like uncharacterized protein
MDRGRQDRGLSAHGRGNSARRRVTGIVSAIAGLVASGTVAIVASAFPAVAAPTASATLTAVTAVSCVSASRCWAGAQDATGSAIIATADGGDTWRVEYATTRFDAIDGIDCTSAAHCLAIGDIGEGSSTAFLETTDGGKAWSTHAVPKSLAQAEAVNCANGSDCWAVGLAGNRVDAAAARTTDGGGVWTPESIPSLVTAMSSPFGISCASSTDCLVTGEAALTTTDGGKTWAKHTVPDGVPLGPVTCPSTRDCYAIFDVATATPSHDQAYIYTSGNGGVTWQDVLSDPGYVAEFGDIACPSTSTCVAVGDGYAPTGSGTDTFYGLSELTSTSGKHWAKSTVAKVQNLVEDSCDTKTKNCVAGGWDSAGAVILKSANDGVTWTSEPLP